MKPTELADKLADLQRLQKQKRLLMQRIVLTVGAEWRREAPVKSGNLRRTETHRVESTGERGVVGTNANYAMAVYKGTKPHTIVPKSPGGVLAFKIGGKTVFAKRVQHPGTKSNDWPDRALANSRDSINQFLTEAGEAYFESVIR